MKRPDIVIVVAVARTGVIGRDNGLPWRLSCDLKRFKSVTMGKPIVMGRKTWDSIGRPLPGRPHVVATRDPDFSADGVSVAHSLQAAIAEATGQAEAVGADEICIIGGASLYAQALPLADRLCVTHIEADIDGDAHFPAIDPGVWEPVHEEQVAADEKNSHPTHYVVYRRRAE